MNLHAIAGPVVAMVNPWVTARYTMPSGVYATVADGGRTPIDATSFDVQVQMQALSYDELKQVDGLNIQGEKRAMYVNGDVRGVDRIGPAAGARFGASGGDKFTLPDGTLWLVVMVLENWATTAGWTKVAVAKQRA